MKDRSDDGKNFFFFLFRKAIFDNNCLRAIVDITHNCQIKMENIRKELCINDLVKKKQLCLFDQGV